MTSSYCKRRKTTVLMAYALALAGCASGATTTNSRPAVVKGAIPNRGAAEGVPTVEQVQRDEHGHPSPTAQAAAPASPTPVRAPQEALASDPERAAYERARPVFERHCARCHTSSGENAKRGSLKHFNMDGYPLGGHHASEIADTVREVLGTNGERPSMPRDNPGAVSGEELALILAWADAFDAAHPSRSVERGHQH